MPSVLAVFAHPDDIELLCAGTLRHLVTRGWTLSCATLCGGDMGSMTLSSAEIRETRLKEAAAGAAALGGSYRWAGLDDFTLHYGPEQLAPVVELVRETDPDVVLTHSFEDYLLDHEEASRLVRMGCFVAGVPLYKTKSRATARIPALYYADALEGKDKLGRTVEPEFWVDVSATFEDRQKALACHDSQRSWLKEHHGVDQYLDTSAQMARAYGARCEAAYAEGFRQHRGHAYPQANVLAEALPGLIRPNPDYPDRAA